MRSNVKASSGCWGMSGGRAGKERAHGGAVGGTHLPWAEFYCPDYRNPNSPTQTQECSDLRCEIDTRWRPIKKRLSRDYRIVTCRHSPARLQMRVPSAGRQSAPPVGDVVTAPSAKSKLCTNRWPGSTVSDAKRQRRSAAIASRTNSGSPVRE